MIKNLSLLLTLLLNFTITYSQSDYTFDPNFRVPDNLTHYYKFAVLPKSTAGTGEMLTVKLIGGGFSSHEKKVENMYLSNRGEFKGYTIQRSGNLLSNKVRVEAYKESEGYTSVYLVMESSYSHGKVFASTSGIASNNILKANPPKLTVTPSGVNVFNSAEQNTSLLINSNGNMAVQGKLEAKEIKVNLTPTADFVFENDYKLPSLDFIEEFIIEKKHLPEIASAKEMKKNGVNIGEFQIKLLQKIEELTLYTIIQQKEIKILKDENAEIKSLNRELKNMQKRLNKLELSIK